MISNLDIRFSDKFLLFTKRLVVSFAI